MPAQNRDSSYRMVASADKVRAWKGGVELLVQGRGKDGWRRRWWLHLDHSISPSSCTGRYQNKSEIWGICCSAHSCLVAWDQEESRWRV